MRPRTLSLLPALALLLGIAAPALAASEPTVGAITPTAATVNAAQTFSATYSDADGVASCNLFVNDFDEGAMSLNGSTSGTATKSHTFNAAGSASVRARCTDSLGNMGLGALTTVTVGSTADTSLPTVPGNLSLTTPSSNNMPVFTWSASSDNVAVTGYDVQLDGGAIAPIGNTTSYTAAVQANGHHTFAVRARDAAGNVSAMATTDYTINASADVSSPSTPANLTLITPSTDSTPTFTWSASSDNTAVTGYQGQLDGGALITLGNATSYTTVTLTNGTHTFSVRAMDAAGNVSSMSSLTFSISVPGVPPVPPPPFSLEQLQLDANLVAAGSTRGEYETSTGRTCEWSSLDASSRTSAVFGFISNSSTRTQIENFAACGTVSTLNLGAGERLGIVNSYRSAFARLPSTAAQWDDVIKIGNGRFTAETSLTAEASAKTRFRTIYLRDANMSVQGDANAVTVMAYGLRPLPRNLNSEAAAIVTFRAVYGRLPASATDWDAVRAVAYSGATR